MKEHFQSYYVDNRGFFLRPFSFKGRIGRKEYIFALFIYFVVFIFVREYEDAVSPDNSELFLLGLLELTAYIFFLCESVKRCHDRNNPGIYVLIPFYILFMIFAPGTKGKNDYGNSPKDPKEEFRDNSNVDDEAETEYLEEDDLENIANQNHNMGANWNLFGGDQGLISEEKEESER